MKHTLIAVLTTALVAAAPAVSAQSGTATDHDDHHAAAGQTAPPDSGAHARMMAALNLTDAQRTQIAAIHAKYEAQMGGMGAMSGMGNMSGMGSTSGMSSMPGMDKMRAQEMAEVRAVLTPEQQQRFDRLMLEHQKNHHAGTEHPGMQM